MPFVRASYLANMLVKIAFMCLALDPVSRFMMACRVRSFYMVLESRQSWSEPLQLLQDAKAELRVGPSELRTYMYIYRRPSQFVPPHLPSEWCTQMLVIQGLGVMQWSMEGV